MSFVYLPAEVVREAILSKIAEFDKEISRAESDYEKLSYLYTERMAPYSDQLSRFYEKAVEHFSQWWAKGFFTDPQIGNRVCVYGNLPRHLKDQVGGSEFPDLVIYKYRHRRAWSVLINSEVRPESPQRPSTWRSSAMKRKWQKKLSELPASGNVRVTVETAEELLLEHDPDAVFHDNTPI